MGEPYFRQTLASQKVSGTLFNTYTTAKTVLNQTELVPIPGNFMQVGRRFFIHVFGGLSNIVTTPGTVTFQVMMGSVAVWSSGALQMSTTANTLSPFWLDVDLRLDSSGTGTAAKFMQSAWISALNLQLGSGVANPTVTDSILMAPAASPAVGTGFDSTVSEILDFWVGFSISNAGNGVQIYDYHAETLASGAQ